jgi:hypothetical protein
MFAAGPHWSDDEQRWEGDGMVVVRAGSLAEAEAIAKDAERNLKLRCSPKMMLVGAGALPFPFRSGWDHEFESALLQQPVCLRGEPRG